MCSYSISFGITTSRFPLSLLILINFKPIPSKSLSFAPNLFHIAPSKFNLSLQYFPFASQLNSLVLPWHNQFPTYSLQILFPMLQIHFIPTIYPIDPSKIPSQLPILPLLSLVTPLSLHKLILHLFHPNCFSLCPKFITQLLHPILIPLLVHSQLPMLPLHSLVTPLSLPKLINNLFHPKYFLYAQNSLHNYYIPHWSL